MPRLSVPILTTVLALLGCEPGERPNGAEAPDVMEAPAVEQHEDADTVFLDPDDPNAGRQP